MNLPERLVANVVGYGGDLGKRWLRNLPELVAAAGDRWQLEELRMLPNLSFNYLAKGLRNGVPCVAKLVWEAADLPARPLGCGRGAVVARWNCWRSPKTWAPI